MSSGNYIRRECLACGKKGRLTGATIFVSVPGLAVEPIGLQGVRCGYCKVESARGLIVRRARGKPGPDEIRARMQVIEIEIRELEVSIDAKRDMVADLRAIHAAMAKMSTQGVEQ